MQFRTRPAALLRGAAGVALALVALGAAAAGGVQQLRDFVAGARSAEGEFEQVVTAQSGRRPQEASGSFAYARPGRFHCRKQTSTTHQEELCKTIFPPARSCPPTACAAK